VTNGTANGFDIATAAIASSCWVMNIDERLAIQHSRTRPSPISALVFSLTKFPGSLKQNPEIKPALGRGLFTARFLKTRADRKYYGPATLAAATSVALWRTF
jgi:hypothetical protein